LTISRIRLGQRKPTAYPWVGGVLLSVTDGIQGVRTNSQLVQGLLSYVGYGGPKNITDFLGSLKYFRWFLSTESGNESSKTHPFLLGEKMYEDVKVRKEFNGHPSFFEK
jgi:hypothetical protein